MMRRSKMPPIFVAFATAKWYLGPIFSSMDTQFQLTFPLNRYHIILCQHLSQLTMLSLKLLSASSKDSLRLSSHQSHRQGGVGVSRVN